MLAPQLYFDRSGNAMPDLMAVMKDALKTYPDLMTNDKHVVL